MGGFQRATATKSTVRSRIFEYGLPKDILSKGQKTMEGEGDTAPPPLRVKGLNTQKDGQQEKI